MQAQRPEGSHVLDLLLQAGKIDQDQVETALAYCHRVGVRAEEGILQTRALSEENLLKFLASVYKTRFVSTDKLSKANVDRNLLRMVPRKAAERMMVCPILWDAKTHTLSVVAGDLRDSEIDKQIQMLSDLIRSVRVYVARPAAVTALIRKHYHGDAQEFAMLLSDMATFGGGLHDDYSFGSGYDEPGFGGASAYGTVAAPAAAPSARPAAPSAPPAYPATPTITLEGPSISFGGADLLKALGSSGAAPTSPARPSAPSAKPPTRVEGTGKGDDAKITNEGFLETLNVLVALLEQDRQELRGHTSQVARLARRLSERIGLDVGQAFGVLVAAYVHDLGKASAYHLTALNVAQYEGHRLQAQKTYLTPVRLLESAKLPASSIDALTHQYERFDGRGFPDRLKGKDIPLGARILAVVESYIDVTSTEKNPYRKKLTAHEALEALGRFKGQFFDPTVVDMLGTVVLGDDLREKLLSERRRAVLVDPDPEETAILEMRLMEHGYEVAIARTADQALERIREGVVDIVISEVDLEGRDGFSLLARLREAKNQVPVVFLTRRGDRDSVTRGFDLGAADYLAKPASPEVVAAKVSQILDRGTAQTPAARGVTGSLQEMSLPDVIQILSNGRKSGRLTIRADGKAGEVHFADGAICEASFGDLLHAEAFYAMLALTDGEFVLDPSFAPRGNVINQPTESLLLEGMRRLDEGMR